MSIDSLVTGPPCSNENLPLGPFTIDSTGSFPSETLTYTTFCGQYNFALSGGFSGRQLRLLSSLTGLTSGCVSFTVTITLSR